MRQHLIRKYEQVCSYIFRGNGPIQVYRIPVDEQIDCIWIGG